MATKTIVASGLLGKLGTWLAGCDMSWLPGETIGNTASEADHDIGGSTTLYTFLWENFSNTQCPVTPGGRGDSAFDDIVANKKIALPALALVQPGGADYVIGPSGITLTGDPGACVWDIDHFLFHGSVVKNSAPGSSLTINKAAASQCVQGTGTPIYGPDILGKTWSDGTTLWLFAQGPGGEGGDVIAITQGVAYAGVWDSLTTPTTLTFAGIDSGVTFSAISATSMTGSDSSALTRTASESWPLPVLNYSESAQSLLGTDWYDTNGSSYAITAGSAPGSQDFVVDGPGHSDAFWCDSGGTTTGGVQSSYLYVFGNVAQIFSNGFICKPASPYAVTFYRAVSGGGGQSPVLTADVGGAGTLSLDANTTLTGNVSGGALNNAGEVDGNVTTSAVVNSGIITGDVDSASISNTGSIVGIVSGPVTNSGNLGLINSSTVSTVNQFGGTVVNSGTITTFNFYGGALTNTGGTITTFNMYARLPAGTALGTVGTLNSPGWPSMAFAIAQGV